MRIFCIGRNYAAHAAELGNKISASPVVFMKSASCLVKAGEKIYFPSHGQDLHHEAEIVVEIGKDGLNISEGAAAGYISSLGVGLDLTLRDVQDDLKKSGLPWEKAKAFDCSAPLGKLLPYKGEDLMNLQIGCRVNGVLRQNGNSAAMIFPIVKIISYLSSIWQLSKGDLIFTGTPEGVGKLEIGDEIEVFSQQLGSSKWVIGSRRG